MRGFRDLVRAERLDAMLDDRHDMDGNTLYNLTFDTTIIPDPGVRGFAGIRVLLSDNPDDLHRDDPGWDTQPGGPRWWAGEKYARERFDALKQRDLFEIYLDWQERAQKLISDSVAQQAWALENSPSDANLLKDKDYLDWTGILSIELCKNILNMKKKSFDTDADTLMKGKCSDLIEQNGTINLRSASRYTELTQVVRIFDKLNFLVARLDQIYREEYTQLREVAKPALLDHLDMLQHKTQAKDLSDHLKQYKNSPLIILPNYGDAVTFCDAASKQSPQRVSRMTPPILFDVYEDLGDNTLPKFKIDCPRVLMPLERLRILAGVVSALQDIGSGEIDPDALDFPNPHELIDNATGRSRFEISLTMERNNPSETFPAQEHRKELRTFPIEELGNASCIAAYIWRRRLASGQRNVVPGRGAATDRTFFHLRVEQDGHGRCDLQLFPKVPSVADSNPDKIECDHWVATPPLQIDKLCNLKFLLEGPTFSGKKKFWTTEAFAYGLSPRLGRSFTLKGSERSRAGASVSGPGLGLGLAAGSGSDVAAEIAEADVVGFNPHPHAPSTEGRAAEFGWIVAPQVAGADVRTLPLEERSLGALVAVPGWWRTVFLRICATGIGEDDLSRIDDASFWVSQRDQCRVETLRLPGTATELSRHLGIEVQSNPFVRRDPSKETEFVVRAGEPANFLLQGGRLWRSTVVTVGGQRADQIVVLPDMNGIVAHYDCVERPNEGYRPDRPADGRPDLTTDGRSDLRAGGRSGLAVGSRSERPGLWRCGPRNWGPFGSSGRRHLRSCGWGPFGVCDWRRSRSPCCAAPGSLGGDRRLPSANTRVDQRRQRRRRHGQCSRRRNLRILPKARAAHPPRDGRRRQQEGLKPNVVESGRCAIGGTFCRWRLLAE